MTVAILQSSERLILAAAAVLFAVLAAVLIRRRPGATSASAAIVAAGVAAGLLVLEQIVALAVRLSAPAQADYNEFRWVMMAPWGRLGMALGALTVAAIVALAFVATRRLASPWRRAALIGLRTAAAVTALILFLQPAIELRQVAREPNRIAIIVDESLSMSLAESPDGPTRIARARAFLDASAPTLTSFGDRHKIDIYTMGTELSPSTLGGVAKAATQGATLVRLALEKVRARYDGRDLAGIVLLSDGVATGGFDQGITDATGRDFIKSLETRVHTAWMARPGLKDVSVARVMADEFAFARTVVRFEAVIRSTGYQARTVDVTLSSDGKPVRHKSVALAAGATETKVVFEVTPPRVGKFVYEISTPVAQDEAVATNNTRAFVLRVIRDKIRVLQVAGQPSWDVRALRRMLKENPNVDLISFFILRTQDDISFVPNDEMSLIPFPTRELFQEELPSFDVIFMQNFEYGPYGIGEYLENIRSYVEGGGGLAMLGGELSFASGYYTGTPVARALPVDLPDPYRPRSELLDDAPFNPKLTEIGKVHPVTALRYEPRDNVALWASLPALDGTNIVRDAKAEATVLAVHPTLKTQSGKPLPILTSGEYGDGRTLALTSDSLWKWGFVAAKEPGADGRHYTKFWENAMRWLIQDPDLRYLHVNSDAVEYEPGVTARLDLRALNRDYTPLVNATVELEIKRGGDPNTAETVLKKTVKVDDEGTATIDLEHVEPGIYRAKATAEIAARPEVANDIFLVKEASAELDHPSGTEALLAEIAKTSGGIYLGAATSLPADLPFDPPRVVRVDRRADVELWSKPVLLALALLLLGFEWLLRQRSGYL